jgi:hypothetical protein
VFQQLTQRIVTTDGTTQEIAAAQVLAADPFDLILCMEELWNDFNPWFPNPAPAGNAKLSLFATGSFTNYAPSKMSPPIPPMTPAWDHFGYSYLVENTRAVQILRRVVREYRSGEGLGTPSTDTMRWLDATEALLFAAANPVGPWLSTSQLRADPELVRRNAYWRLFGLDLAFGTDDNRAPVYDKAKAYNQNFLRLFEELLYELWQAICNETNFSGVNNTDNDRIYRLSEELKFILRSRRQTSILAREELAAAAVTSWVELTLSANTPVVVDLRAQATDPADRLKIIGERVELMPHSKSSEFFSMCSEMSKFLRIIESGNAVTSSSNTWYLYKTTGGAIGADTKRLITEWAAATGKDLKSRGKPVELNVRRLSAA